jgi:hypothetical protein
MRALKSLSLLLIIIVLSLAGCRPDELLPGDGLAHIPQTVSSVSVLNIARLMEKADFEQVKGMDFYRHVVEEVRSENASFSKILEDPAKAGVDLERNVYISVELEKPEESGFIALLFSIRDKTAFEQALKDLDLQFVPANQEPGILIEESSALLWNDELGILGLGKAEIVQSKTQDYLALDESGSISRNKDFRKAFSEDYDVFNWFSSSHFVDIFQLEELTKFTRYKVEDLRENYLHSYLHFAEGEIRAESRYVLQKRLSNDLGLVLRNKVSTDFTDKVPHDKLFFYSNFGVNPKGLNQLLIEYNVKGISSGALREFGVSFADLIEAFSGDAAVAVYQERSDRTLNIPYFLLALDIEDEGKLNNMLMAAVEAGFLRSVGEDRYELLRKPELNNEADSLPATAPESGEEMLIKNGVVYLSSNDDLLDAIAGGNFNTGGQLPKDLAELAAQNAIAALADLAWMAKVEDDFANFPARRMQFTTSREKAEATMEMNDQEENSLKQFFEWMNTEYQQKEIRRQEREAEDKKS